MSTRRKNVFIADNDRIPSHLLGARLSTISSKREIPSS